MSNLIVSAGMEVLVGDIEKLVVGTYCVVARRQSTTGFTTRGDSTARVVTNNIHWSYSVCSALM